MKKRISCFLAVVSVASLIPSLAAADSIDCQNKYSADQAKKGLQREQKAENILAKINSDALAALKESQAHPNLSGKADIVNKSIPAALLAKAKCVVVIPGEKSVAFGFGGDEGQGIKECRGADGKMGAPSFVKIAGGSSPIPFIGGGGIGYKNMDRVMLFMNDDADQTLGKSQIHLGVDAAVVAGPIGVQADVDTNLGLKDKVLSYSHSEGLGLYAGFNLSGAVLQPDQKMDDAVAGQNVKRGWLSKLAYDISHPFHHSDDKVCALVDASSLIGKVAPEQAISLNSNSDLAAQAISTTALDKLPQMAINQDDSPAAAPAAAPASAAVSALVSAPEASAPAAAAEPADTTAGTLDGVAPLATM